jgi:hypothetical protein
MQNSPPGKDDLVGVTLMVDGVRPRGIVAASPVDRDGTRGADGGFSIEMGARQVQGARLSTVAGIGLEGMLMLQSVDEAVERDRSARKRGKAMIAALSDLQRALLGDEDPSLALRSLSDLASDHPLAADPGLADILRAVVLRSRVEIARRSRRGA